MVGRLLHLNMWPRVDVFVMVHWGRVLVGTWDLPLSLVLPNGVHLPEPQFMGGFVR